MRPVRFVALGDSYTIGTSVAEAERWPNQLAAAVPAIDLVANLGVNGFTARDVLEVEVPRLAGLEPGLVSLLVGVNDVIQGVPEADYAGRVGTVLDVMAGLVGPGRCLFVTTPDYTVTPAGADYGARVRVSAALRRFNTVASGVASDRGVAVVDIYDLSLRAAADRTLVARDGLHPSGLQYSLWVDRIQPVVAGLVVPGDN
jgi:acyl-CoA thioesterase-1